MPIFIFNSKREFWNDATRDFQKEPHEIRTMTGASMEIRMAARRDDTSDMICFEDADRDTALNTVRSIRYTKDRLRVLKDMNGCLR